MTLIESRTCKSCSVEKVISEFPLKSKKNDPDRRYDVVCTSCRIAIKKHRREKLKAAQPAFDIKTSQGIKGVAAEKSKTETPVESKDVYKKFVYPDGRVLSLTKVQFDEIVNAFRLLINSKRKQEGKPLLLGGN